MGMTCKVCNSPHREAIDRELVQGKTMRVIASRYGMSATSVQRHKANHLPALMVKAQYAAEIATAEALTGRLHSILTRSEAILARCEKAGDDKTALQAIKEVRNTLELCLRVAGELKQGVTNISVHPEVIELKTLIIDGLSDFPKARTALIKIFERTEHD